VSGVVDAHAMSSSASAAAGAATPRPPTPGSKQQRPGFGTPQSGGASTPVEVDGCEDDAAEADEPVDGDLSSKVLEWTTKGTNPKWRCLSSGCGQTGHGKARAVDHLEKHSRKSDDLVAFLKHEAQASATRKRKREDQAKVTAVQNKEKSKALSGKGPVDLLIHKSAIAELNKLTARYLLATSQSFLSSECENFRDYLDGVIALARSPAGAHLKALDLVKRTAMTRNMKEEAGIVWEKYIATFRRCIESNGGTIVVDGRSSITTDPMLFFGIETVDGFLWMFGENAGVNKKGARYLADCFTDCARVRAPDDESPDQMCGFGRNMFAVMQDNAASCAAAAKLVEADKDVSLVYLNCMIHALSLLPAWAFRHIGEFSMALTQLEVLISFFRKRSRAKQILRACATTLNQGTTVKACVLLRLIPTRFMIHAMTFKRALKLKSAMLVAANDPQMKQYKLESKCQKELEDVEGVLGDKTFWAVARFIAAALEPFVKAETYLDRADSKSSDVRSIFSVLGDSLAAVMGNQEFDMIKVPVKMKLMDLFQSLWSQYETPGHVASWMLHPENQDAVRLMAVTKVSADKDAFLIDISATKHVLSVVVRRLSIVNPEAVPDGAKALQECFKDFALYVYKPEDLQLDADMASLGAPQYWGAQRISALALAACVIVAFPSGSQSLERSHKINAKIHTSERASLSAESVDLCTKGNIALNAARLLRGRKTNVDRPSRKAWFEDFGKMTDADEEAAERYYDAIRATDKVLAVTLSTTGGAFPGVSGPSAAETTVEDEDSGSDDEPDASSASPVPPPVLVPEPDAPPSTTTRVGRSVRPTPKFVAAMQALKAKAGEA
jgi:hypothetical protein